MARRAVAEVNLAAIERNAELLRGRVPARTQLCAVVKANGYGHGAVQVAGAALRGGATVLAVVTAGEAGELRRAGLDAPILVLGAISDEELPEAVAANADLTAWDPGFIETLRLLAKQTGRPIGVHVKLDTGMGRLGTRDLDQALATVHAANSAAILRVPHSHFDMVRAGIALYGCDPMNNDPDDHGLEPALALRSYVAAVKPIAPGQSIGYSRRFIAERDSNIATLPIGYGDGVVRALANNCDVLIGGRRYPLRGMVSMDNITVDVGSEPLAWVGDRATLIGVDGDQRQTAEEVSRRVGTISNEVLCWISRRVPRVYHRDGRPV